MNATLLTTFVAALGTFVVSMLVAFGLGDQATAVKAVFAAAGPLVIAAWGVVAHRTEVAKINASASVAAARAQTPAAPAPDPSALTSAVLGALGGAGAPPPHPG